MRDGPAGVVAMTVWAYWSTVVLLVIYKRIRFGHGAGLLPRQRREKRLWFGIAPVVLAWNVLPILAATLSHGPFGLPRWAHGAIGFYGRCGFAALAVACYLATVYCWLQMGRNWSMAIVPRDQTELVTGGLYGWVRHPIYSLSISLMVCTAVVVANWPMLVTAVLHVVFMYLKAGNEERYLMGRHGPTYADYCGRVGRFVPRPRSLAGR